MAAEETDVETIRGLAERWEKRARFDAGEAEQEDCEACGGEAVGPAAILEHEDNCDYWGHDIGDDGGGTCTTCGEKLPPCTTCGPYHGRKAPPGPLDDAQLAELLGWVRERMAAYVTGGASRGVEVVFPRDCEPMAEWLALDLFDVDDATSRAHARALGEAAGWPS